jgi:asparagine synthase (glutamine-hydrolysing)
MKGIIPDEILKVTNRRGRQSSDYAYRVNNAFNLGIKKEILTMLENKKLYDYLDASKIELLKKRIENSNKLNEDEIQNILCICSLSVFLQIHYGNC